MQTRSRYRIILALLAALLLGPLVEASAQPRSPRAARRDGQETRAQTQPSEQESLAERLAQMQRRIQGHFRAQRYAEARDLLLEVVALAPDDETGWYNLACAQCLLGDTDAAIDALARAVERGWSDFRHMERDEDLAALRDTAFYRALLSQRDQIQRRRAEQIFRELQAQFGEGYLVEVDHDNRLVFATNVDRATLDELKARLTAQAEALRAELFTHGFEQYVTVVIPKDGTLRGAIGGFYSPQRRLLVARSIGMTLAHEFTHALHAADMEVSGQEHPIWAVEGLATLFESSQLVDGRLVPVPSYRLNVLKRLVQRKMTIPWHRLFQMSQEDFVRHAAITYPESQYVLAYLHDKGVLAQWYDEYVANYESDPRGVEALKKVLGVSVGQAERDWLAWIDSLEAPAIAIEADHAYIGILMSPTVDGLRIDQVVADSAAERAGLQVNDVLVSIDGQRVADPEDVIRRVQAAAVGDVLELRYRRDGEYHTVPAELLPKPEDLQVPRR